MAMKVAAKPARRKTAKKQKAVKRNEHSELSQLIRAAARKARSKKVKAVRESKMVELCQHFVDQGHRASIVYAPWKHRPKKGVCKKHYVPKVVLPPRNMPRLEDRPVMLSLMGKYQEMVRTGRITKDQAAMRMADWNRIYPNQQVMVM